ncbi:MAG: ROK family protein [Acidobacteria bacterium]|nr:MAG: ROK family protein [Acidobacteriota bacterium]
MHYLGIDVGGTSIKAGLVNEAGRVLESRRALTVADDLNGFLSALTELVRGFQKAAAIDAIGIGVPGLHSSRTHIIETSPNLPCLRRVNLEELLADQVHIRTISENDANAAAYAEFVCGAGVGLRHMAHLTIGTGLGSGFVLNGSLFTGASGYGGEFGHTVLNAGSARQNAGRLCGCGNHGCVEMFVSATGIVLTAEDMMREAPESLLHDLEWPLTSEKIYEVAVRGDAIAREVFKETARYLGIACANLINLLNLEMIIIGGGVMGAGDLLMNSAREIAQRHAFPSAYADCRIVQSKLWPDAGMIGAAMLARDR